MKLSSIKVDASKIENGAWVNQIAGAPGLHLKVRGMNSKAARKLREELTEAIPRSQRIVGLPLDVQDRIEAQVLAGAVLLDWHGLTDEATVEGLDGPITREIDVPHSPAKALELISDQDYMILRGAVIWAANYVAELGEEELKADVGN